jgi:hypothetical protein
MQLKSPGSILLAALALPGLHGAAHADTPPERGEITLGYLDYQDRQPGLDRVKVHAPAFSIMAPVAGAWTLEASLVHDSISGATPRYHTAISGASHMDDSRIAADLRVTRHFSRGSLSVSASRSNENDYLSRALGVQGSIASADQNTSFTFGAGVANDRINPVNGVVHDERKHTVELMAGVTQVLGVRDIAQFDLTHTDGEGYFSDPYKFLDIRPRSRIENTALLRWNHRFDASGGTSRASYRYYRDSFGIRAHTFSEEYVQPLAGGWTLTPSARLYSQSAASFYFDAVYDPVFGPPSPPNFAFTPGLLITQDQRMAAFGALTFGLKAEKKLGADWLVDVKVDDYRQRAGLHLGGSGSPGLAPFYARTWQLSLTRLW